MLTNIEGRFPIWEVAADHIVSTMGDITIAFLITLPEIFTLSGEELRILHQAWVKAINILSVNTLLQKMDWYTRSNWQANPTAANPSFLSQASDQYHQGRPYLNHHCWLFLSRRPKGRGTNNSSSALLRKSLVPDNILSEQAIEAFDAQVEQFVRILTDSGLIRMRRLSTDELASTDTTPGIIEQYCGLLGSGESRLLQDVSFDNGFRVGGKYCRLHTLADCAHLPEHCSASTNYAPYSTDRTPFPIGFATPLGLLLDCNHIYTQYIFIEDEQSTRKNLEQKGRRMQSLSTHARENTLGKAAIDEFLNESIAGQKRMVKVHFNILSWTEEPGEVREVDNKVTGGITKSGATPHLETVLAPQIWCSGIPGNAGDLPLGETFDLFTEAAACFLIPDTNYGTDAGDTGVRLGDRLHGRPVQVDLSDRALREGWINNFNKFVLGGSGSGKSFFVNLLLSSHYEQGAHICIADIGNSYKGLCDLVGGYYFTYTQETPLCFNPFWLPEGVILDMEKKESLITLLLVIWKKAEEGFLRSEYVTLSNAIKQYFEHLATHEDIFPCFNSFYEFLQDEFIHTLAENRIKDREFDMHNFLYVIRPFYKGGEYDFLLNARENINLLEQRFIVFELDTIKDHFLFPVVTIIIMEVFTGKMRKLTGIRKIMLIEECWKAIARQSMSEYIQYLFKTVRKFNGEAIVVTQEVEDIISSPVVKQAIINNSDCKILLDQSKFQNKFDFIQDLLGLTEKEKALVLSLNKNNDPNRKYKEVFIALGTHSKVYRVEVSLEEYLTYTTRESEKMKVQQYARQHGGMRKGIEALATAIRKGSVKLLLTGTLVICGLLVPSGPAKAQFPIAEIISAAIKKVIVATDLAIQRLQTQTIYLQNAQKAIENAMQQTQLGDITDWVQRQKDLYEEYYQELWQVKNAISLYQEVATITERQAEVLTGYKRALATLRQDPHFSAVELEHIARVYGGILAQSVQNASGLLTVISAFTSQMEDGDRLHIVDRLADNVDQNYRELQQFTQENILLSLQRSKDQQDINFIKSLYGIQ